MLAPVRGVMLRNLRGWKRPREVIGGENPCTYPAMEVMDKLQKENALSEGAAHLHTLGLCYYFTSY